MSQSFSNADHVVFVRMKTIIRFGFVRRNVRNAPNPPGPASRKRFSGQSSVSGTPGIINYATIVREGAYFEIIGKLFGSAGTFEK